VDVRSNDHDTLTLLCKQMSGVGDVQPTPDAIRVTLTGLSVPEFNAKLVKRDVAVHALVPVARNLEQLFLEVTT